MAGLVPDRDFRCNANPQINPHFHPESNANPKHDYPFSWLGRGREGGFDKTRGQGSGEAPTDG